MKSKKRTRIAILVVVLLSSLSFWLFQKNKNGTLRKELYDFAVEDTASISKIYMVSMAGKQITLTKNKPGEWTVNGKFIARNEAANNLLACIKDLQVKQPVAKSAIESISKQMSATSTKVEIYKRDELIKSYYVGNDAQDNIGTFMLLIDTETGKNSSLPFIMFIPGFNGILSVRYFLDEELWRNRSVFAFYPDQISSIEVKHNNAFDSSFIIQLSDKNEISMTDSKGEKIPWFDTLKTKRYITYYNNIQYEMMKNDLRSSFMDSIISKGPIYTITLTDREGTKHTVKAFAKPAHEGQTDPVTGKPLSTDIERMYALINDNKDFVSIQYYVFGKLFQPLSYFKTPTSLDKAIGVKK